MTAYTYTLTDLSIELNLAREQFIGTILEEGIITGEIADKIGNYCFVVVEKGFFGKVFDKLLWRNDTSKTIRVIVKMLEIKNKNHEIKNT